MCDVTCCGRLEQEHPRRTQRQIDANQDLTVRHHTGGGDVTDCVATIGVDPDYERDDERQDDDVERQGRRERRGRGSTPQRAAASARRAALISVYPPLMGRLLCAALVLALACGDDDSGTDAGGRDAAMPPDAGGMDSGDVDSGGTDSGGTDSGVDAGTTGPNVDRSDPMLHEFELNPEELDPTVMDSIEPSNN